MARITKRWLPLATPPLIRLTVPGAQLYDLPPQPFYPYSLHAFEDSLVFQNLPPLANYDLSVPRGPEYPSSLRNFLNPSELQLVGQDRQFAGPGQFKSYDWPLPNRGPVYSGSLRTSLASPQPPATVASAPFSYDWPLPGRVTPLLRTFTDSLVVLYVLPHSNFDWPLPTPPRRQDLGFTQNSPINLPAPTRPPIGSIDWPLPRRVAPLNVSWTDELGLMFFPPETNYDWPVPKAAARLWDISSYILSGPSPMQIGSIPTPQAAFDYPLPKTTTYSNDLRTNVQQFNKNLLGQDRQFAGPGQFKAYDWPVPRGLPPNVQLFGDSSGTPLDLRSQAPATQAFDWPLPQTRPYPYSLRSWNSTSAQFFGQDKFFGLAGHPNFDWPVPRGPWRSPQLQSWTQSPGVLILPAPAIPATHTYDWPLPRAALRGRDLLTWINPRIPFAPPAPPVPGVEQRPIKQPYGGSGYGSRTARGLRSQSTQQGMSHREIELLLAQLPSDEQAEFRQMMDDDEVAYLLTNMDWMR